MTTQETKYVIGGRVTNSDSPPIPYRNFPVKLEYFIKVGNDEQALFSRTTRTDNDGVFSFIMLNVPDDQFAIPDSLRKQFTKTQLETPVSTGHWLLSVSTKQLNIPPPINSVQSYDFTFA